MEQFVTEWTDVLTPNVRLAPESIISFIIIRLPKTRWLAARRQHARLKDALFAPFFVAVQALQLHCGPTVLPAGAGWYSARFRDGILGLGAPYGEAGERQDPEEPDEDVEEVGHCGTPVVED